MKFRTRAATVLTAALAAWWAVGVALAPPVFTVSLSNPVVGQPVQLRDASDDEASPRAWDFGDGTGSSSPSPMHAWTAPGEYAVRLTSGGAEAARRVVVSPETVLRLVEAHPFEVTLVAVDPHSGETSPGRAIPQSDVFGYFSFPEITHDAGNPEVFVKILDAGALGQGFWIFYGGLTSLAYTLTVRETVTGRVQVYEKELGNPCGGFDTAGFPFVTVTPTATSSPFVPPTATFTRTRTRTPTPPLFTPTPPLATLTPTPTFTPSVTVVRLRGIPWQWDFYAPGVEGGSSITLRKGRSYEFHVYDDAPDDSDAHAFSGIPGIGLSGVNPLIPGEPDFVQTVTPQTLGDFPFLCTDSACGVGHSDMVGIVHVVP